MNVLPEYEVALKIAKAEYEGCKGVIKEEVEKMDASEDREKAALLFPAESHKQDLASRYGKIMEAVGKMTRALELSGENEASIIDKTGFKYNDEAKLVSELNQGLEKMILIQKRTSEKENPPVKAPATETSAIKLGKAEQIMFSGNSRDFAAFKKDFETRGVKFAVQIVAIRPLQYESRIYRNSF